MWLWRQRTLWSCSPPRTSSAPRYRTSSPSAPSSPLCSCNPKLETYVQVTGGFHYNVHLSLYYWLS